MKRLENERAVMAIDADTLQVSLDFFCCQDMGTHGYRGDGGGSGMGGWGGGNGGGGGGGKSNEGLS